MYHFLSALISVLPVTLAVVPVVDLGYEVHRAIANNTGDYYNFTNIRYGAPPLGDLRWMAPVAPKNISREVVDGSQQGGTCPQTFPCWFQVQTAFTDAYLAGEEFNFTASYNEIYADGVCSSPTPAADRIYDETEDCLFLDVFVPKTIMDQKNTTAAPVVVYIFGGGYSGGSKTSSGNPAGLLERSRARGSEGVIYVGINYRLGALGWMFGSKFEAEGGLVNAGLYDQRLALHWVQKYIRLFGGDPNRVTAVGESAGGGSIIMQMTAWGGNESTPFQQAATQSAAWEPATAGAVTQNRIYDHFLSLLNVTSLAEAKKLSSQQIIDANHILLASAEYGSVFLGPVVDGTFVPEDPKKLLLQGRVDKSVKLLTTHASNEGLRFAPANITTEADFEQYATLFLNTANGSVQQYVINTLYPPVFDGSLPYTNNRDRAGLFWAELVSTCNPQYMHSASSVPGYSNLFDVWPAVHQGDVPYVFWNGPGTDQTVNETVAEVIQDYVTSFAISGDPNNVASPHFDYYNGEQVLDMSNSTFGAVGDVTINPRCTYLHQALYQ